MAAHDIGISASLRSSGSRDMRRRHDADAVDSASGSAATAAVTSHLHGHSCTYARDVRAMMSLGIVPTMLLPSTVS
jgi:hypothetical protein